MVGTAAPFLLMVLLLHNCATPVEGFAPDFTASAGAFSPPSLQNLAWSTTLANSAEVLMRTKIHSVIYLGEDWKEEKKNEKDGPGGESEDSYGDWAESAAYLAIAAGVAGAALVAPRNTDSIRARVPAK